LRREAADFGVHPIPWQRCYEIRPGSLSHPKKMAEEGIKGGMFFVKFGMEEEQKKKQQHRLGRT